jgi:hypothetical protein
VISSAIYGIFYFLSFGASRIAPLSENLATRKRIAAILFSALALLFGILVDWKIGVTVSGIVLGFSCIDALTERPPIFGPVVKPLSGNIFTRLTAYFFSPGWHTGIFYFILCSVFWGTLFAFLNPKLGAEEELKTLMYILGFIGTISFPLIFIHLFFKKVTSTQMNFGIYLFIQICLAVVTILVTFLAETNHRIDDIVYSCMPIPSVILVGLSENNGVDRTYFLGALILALVLSIGIPLIRGRHLFKEMAETMRKK